MNQEEGRQTLQQVLHRPRPALQPGDPRPHRANPVKAAHTGDFGDCAMRSQEGEGEAALCGCGVRMRMETGMQMAMPLPHQCQRAHLNQRSCKKKKMLLSHSF